MNEINHIYMKDSRNFNDFGTNDMIVIKVVKIEFSTIDTLIDSLCLVVT